KSLRHSPYHRQALTGQRAARIRKPLTVVRLRFTMFLDGSSPDFSMVRYVNTYSYGHRLSGSTGGQKTMRKQLLGIILALSGPTAVLGQSVTPADLAGDWAFAAELYGETDYHRMTLRAVGDQVTIALDGLTLEGRIRDGKI